MSAWQDIVTSQPQEAQLVLVRRIPGECPPLAGQWDAVGARFLCGPEQWPIPWSFISQWRPAAAEPAWPQPRNGASPWQDVYLCPPAEGQSVWVRRYALDTAAFRAVFDRSARVFALASGWQVHWYETWRWRAG
jgi:hypothetical protein